MNVMLILPVLNEEKALRIILPNVCKYFDDIVIIDGNSSDKSVEIGENMGAKVILQNRMGKGNAVRQAWKIFLDSGAEVACMIDADGTCDPMELYEALSLLNQTDIIFGNRFNKERPLSMNMIPRIVNWLVSIFVSIRIKKRIHDAQTPFWIWNRKSIKIIASGVRATKFEFEVDMVLQANWANLRITEVPISYHKRIGKSKFSFSLRLRNLFIIPYLLVKKRNGLRN